ncbi:hypothetical protein SOCE26_042810 [Sorangium cellulosum]|uniref:DUF2169 domain-containing protein n=1 Tax=Sorangium cellulosum TaxID=56 RepID=A0A2L0EU75_SORCE|nr:DUF2169 domain-containing protein [Sorangium cellulosum]AUX42846.1 hypothetical protein SOCE26_042810 [Sorangium cellulosum]
MQPPWPLSLVALAPSSCGAVLWRMQGAERLTVIVKATFALVHERRAELTAAAEQLVRSDSARDGRGSLEQACETAPYLPGAGVLVRGHAAAPAGQTATALSVRVALFREDRWVLNKVLHVFGDSTREARSPRPFSLMPIVYERAFGGPHVDANPVGVGSGAALPNIVDPVDPARPAGFGPIARHWAPRRRLLAQDQALDAPVPELDAGFDFRYFHAAPADQQIDFLRGDEWIVLQGLHPNYPWIRSCLPSARALARLHRVEPRGEDPGQPIELVADTLTIDADHLLCSVIWRGNVAVLPGETPDRLRVVAGVEVPGRPLPWLAAPAAPSSRAPLALAGPGSAPAAPAAEIPGGHWSATTQQAAPLHAPPPLPFVPASGQPPPRPEPPRAPAALAGPGSVPAAPGAEIPGGHWSGTTQQVALSEGRPSLPFAQIPDRHWSTVTQMAAPLQALPSLPFAQIPEGHWSMATQMVRPLQAPPPLPFSPGPAPPPRPEPPAEAVPFAMPFARRGAAPPPPAGDLPPADEPPATTTQPPADEPPTATRPPPAPLDQTTPPAGESAALEEAPPALAPGPVAPADDGPPAQAAEVPAAPPEPAPEARGLRAVLLVRLREGQPLYDLDLSGVELDGIDFSGAALDGMNLAGARLTGCNFTSARLSRTNLSGADLTGARLHAADLSHADLSRATLDHAEFGAAILRNVDLTSARGANASFEGASLDGADLRQARLVEASFDRASLAGINGSKADLSRSRFEGASLAGAILRAAKLKEASLPHANVDGADLREADLSGANVYDVKLANAKSSGATLRNLVETAPANNGENSGENNEKSDSESEEITP